MQKEINMKRPVPLICQKPVRENSDKQYRDMPAIVTTFVPWEERSLSQPATGAPAMLPKDNMMRICPASTGDNCLMSIK